MINPNETASNITSISPTTSAMNTDILLLQILKQVEIERNILM